MVTSSPERRSRAEYTLELIRELARGGSIAYIGTTESDAAEINYEPEHVGECLCCLGEEHYDQSIRYDPQQRWRDVYHIDHEGPDGITRKLYIKLHVDRSCVCIYLNSFHPRKFNR